MAGFDSSDPAVGSAGTDSASAGPPRIRRTYRATVSRWMPNSRAIRRWDQPWPANASIAF